jgi:hypothetical protein
MSSPTDRNFEPGDPSPYAPRWVRNAPQQRRAPVPPPPAGDAYEPDEANAAHREDVIGSDQAPPLATAAPVDHDDGFFVDEYRVPRSLDPGIVPDPWVERGVRLRRYRLLGMLGRLALAGSAAAIVAVLVVGKLSAPASTGATEQAETQPPSARLSAPDNKPQQPPIVAEEASDPPQQVALADPSTPVAAPRPSVAVAPPAPIAALPAPAPPPAADPAPAASAPATPELRTDELAALLKRGQQLAASGDMAAARLTLRRAADAHNAQAALALGATYDPVVLASLGIFGVTPDVAMARSWYEKATAYGSAEAPRRLELLARGK